MGYDTILRSARFSTNATTLSGILNTGQCAASRLIVSRWFAPPSLAPWSNISTTVGTSKDEEWVTCYFEIEGGCTYRCYIVSDGGHGRTHVPTSWEVGTSDDETPARTSVNERSPGRGEETSAVDDQKWPVVWRCGCSWGLRGYRDLHRRQRSMMLPDLAPLLAA